jgi:spermidine synthase
MESPAHKAPLSSFRRLYGLFFVSGMSGLIYQVVWVRQFANVFGNSVYSAAIVTAIFMAGLGLGGWIAGGYIDARFATQRQLPLKLYAYFEALIGFLGLVTALVLPELGSFAASISSYSRMPNGWYTLSLGSSLLRYAVPIVLLTPVTTLMGATLTLLIRFVVHREVTDAGVRVGMLYGFNTAGAALGCLLTDLFLVPHIGLFSTQAFASLGNFAAAFGALRLAAAVAADAPPAESQTTIVESTTADERNFPLGVHHRRVLLGASSAALLSGVVGMGMEIVWFRYLMSMLDNSREVFSLLLGTILIGMWVGSTLAGVLHQRFGNAAVLYASAQSVLLVATAAPLMAITRAGLHGWITSVWTSVMHAPRWLQALVLLPTVELLPCALVTALPAVVMGMTFPLANAAAQDAANSVGRRAGMLYAANTVGAVLGATFAGFWLLPQLGTQGSVRALLLCSMASLLPLFWVVPAARRRTDGRAFAISAVVGVLVLGVWSRLPSNWLIHESTPTPKPEERQLAASEGIGETIVITQRSNALMLYTNGHSMSSTAFSAQRYMRLFPHLPLLSMDHPTDALVICFGVGNTLNATSLHPELQRIDMVDISEHVLSHAKYFSSVNGEPLKDPRVSVYVNDGRHHLRMVPPSTYDLITAEPPPISEAGVAALYSSDFYRLAKSRLKPGGIITYWLPISQVSGDVGLSAVRAFVDAFPNAVLLEGYDYDLILVGVNGQEPFRLDPERVMTRMQASPQIQKDMERAGVGNLLELAGLFVASPRSLHEATTGVLPVTDDYPVLEYGSGQLTIDRTPISGALFRIDRDFSEYCPRCGEPQFAEQLADLPAYLHVLSQLYTSPKFLTRSGQLSITANSREARVIRSSKYLRHLLIDGEASSSR